MYFSTPSSTVQWREGSQKFHVIYGWFLLNVEKEVPLKHLYRQCTVDDGVEKYIFSIGFFEFNLIFG